MSRLIPHLRLVSDDPLASFLHAYEPQTFLKEQRIHLASLEQVNEETCATLCRQVRQSFGGEASMGICIPEAIKAVFFDMDSTVIEQESVVELAAKAGVREHVDRITKDAMAGKLDFESALRERVKLLRGVTEQQIEEVASSLTLTTGIAEFASFCNTMNVPIYLVSGGFVRLAQVVQKALGFRSIHANTLASTEGVLTGDLVGPVVDAQAKLSFVTQTCAELGIEQQNVAAVGDGANDIPMLDAVGCAVGFRPKAVLFDHIDAYVGKAGHGFLVPLFFGRSLSDVRQNQL